MTISNQLVGSSLVQLAYVSAEVRPLTEAEIKALMTFSAERNVKAGITGLLLYKDGKFLQLIEGPELEIDALFARIRSDSRHHNVIKLFRTPIAERGFPEWSMAYSNIGAPLIRNNRAFSAYLQTSLIEPEFGGMPAKTRELLQTFRSTVR
jgi:FAD-dependent sensor of blue light